MGSNGSRKLPHPWAETLGSVLSELEATGLERSVLTLEAGPGPRVELDGQSLTLFTSNNYLGLSTDPRVVEGSVRATREFGASVSASRLLCGSTPLHGELERRLAALKRREACLLFSSGYMANLGLLSALGGPDTVIFSDQRNHASIIDGCRLGRSRTEVYGHLDLDELEALLRRTEAQRRLIVSESVFSMDGDLAPVPELVMLADRFGALLVLDEAHATGVLGPEGEGALGHFGVHEGPFVVVGTLSKALGSAGGFVAGDARMIRYLQNTCRPFIFNTALPAAAVGAALAALDVVEAEPWRRDRLMELAGRLRDGLVRLGRDTAGSSTGIVPMVVGAAETAVQMEHRLRSKGVLARAIRPPTVPEGTSRIRFNVMATHEESDIRRVLDAVSPVGVG